MNHMLGIGERTCVSVFVLRNVAVHVLMQQFSPVPGDLQIFDLSKFSLQNPLSSLSFINVLHFHSAPEYWEKAGIIPRSVDLPWDSRAGQPVLQQHLLDTGNIWGAWYQSLRTRHLSADPALTEVNSLSFHYSEQPSG